MFLLVVGTPQPALLKKKVLMLFKKYILVRPICVLMRFQVFNNEVYFTFQVLFVLCSSALSKI